EKARDVGRAVVEVYDLMSVASPAERCGEGARYLLGPHARDALAIPGCIYFEADGEPPDEKDARHHAACAQSCEPLGERGGEILADRIVELSPNAFGRG